jgi:alpha 1,3-glucosidase
MNSAETWVDIMETTHNKKDSRLINFVSESGKMEFFLIASAASNAPKRVQKLLATVTGFQVLPPYFSLGFHYSKWTDSISVPMVIDWNQGFETAKIPVDVFWLDIAHSEGNMYFTFSE